MTEMRKYDIKQYKLILRQTIKQAQHKRLNINTTVLTRYSEERLGPSTIETLKSALSSYESAQKRNTVSQATNKIFNSNKIKN